MGEAKRRGTFEERKVAAITKTEERERLWQEKQRQRNAERLKGVNITSTLTAQTSKRTRLLVVSALAIASVGYLGKA